MYEYIYDNDYALFFRSVPFLSGQLVATFPYRRHFLLARCKNR